MINISVYKNADKILGITIKGHSDYAPKGADIVCAGVSAIGIGVLNAIYEITKVKPKEIPTEGDLKVEFELDNDSQLIAKVMLIQLKTIEESYSKHVKIHYI